MYRIDRGEHQWEEAADEDKKDRGEVSHSEPENRDRNPRQRRNGPQDLENGIQRHLRPAVPADRETQRNGGHHSQRESPCHPKERRNYIFQQEPMTHQIDNATHYAPRAGQQMTRLATNADLPQQQQQRNERERTPQQKQIRSCRVFVSHRPCLVPHNTQERSRRPPSRP